jgi:hypothetical protein
MRLSRGFRQRLDNINQGLANPRLTMSAGLNWNANWESQANTSMLQNKR